MGTSAGALAGSLYCAGFSAEEVSHGMLPWSKSMQMLLKWLTYRVC